MSADFHSKIDFVKRLNIQADKKHLQAVKSELKPCIVFFFYLTLIRQSCSFNKRNRILSTFFSQDNGKSHK